MAAKSPDFEHLAGQKGYLVLTTWGSSSDLKVVYIFPLPSPGGSGGSLTYIIIP